MSGSVDQPSLALPGMYQLTTAKGASKMEPQTFTFASSPFVPVAIGFFGLGTGYFIWVVRRYLVFLKPVPKLTEAWVYGVSGCRVSCSFSRAFTC
jgi:hypothetical protein